MCKTDFHFALFFRDIKNNVCVIQLTFVFNKVKLAVQDVPNDFLAWDQFCEFLFGTVDIFVTVRELGPESVGVAFNFS